MKSILQRLDRVASGNAPRRRSGWGSREAAAAPRSRGSPNRRDRALRSGHGRVDGSLNFRCLVGVSASEIGDDAVRLLGLPGVPKRLDHGDPQFGADADATRHRLPDAGFDLDLYPFYEGGRVKCQVVIFSCRRIDPSFYPSFRGLWSDVAAGSFN